MAPAGRPGRRGRVIVSQIHLEGFGQFRDRRIELGRSLTLIHGPNEAGKSTLRAFLTWMLFGTRQGRGGEGARWQPHSGSIAGRLLLVHEERQYLIRRTGPTLQVHGPQLPSAGEEALATLLPRADRNLFEMVFSVDGFDLAKAAALTGQRVQEVLMAGAFTGTRMAPTQAIQAERSARSVEAEASRSLTAAERDVAEVVVDKRILAVGPQIERRFGELGKLEDRIRVLPALAERESQAKRRLSAHLASLGKDWTVDVLDAVDVSAARVAEAEDLARAVVPLLDRVPEDEHRATEALKDTTSRRHQARDALDRTAMAPQTAALLARIERLLEREADVQRDAAQRLELAAEIERLSADATPSDAGVPELDESVIEEVDGWRRKLEEAEATLRAGLQSARERVQSAEETVSLSRAELGCIVRDRMAEGLTTRVAALEDALRSLPSLVERANASRREAAATRQEIAVKLSALGVPTSALSGLDPSHAVIHRLQDSVNAQREAVNQQKLANAALDEARRRVRESAIAAGPSAEVVESRRQALTRLRAAFEDVVAA